MDAKFQGSLERARQTCSVYMTLLCERKSKKSLQALVHRDWVGESLFCLAVLRFPIECPSVQQLTKICAHLSSIKPRQHVCATRTKHVLSPLLCIRHRHYDTFFRNGQKYPQVEHIFTRYLQVVDVSFRRVLAIDKRTWGVSGCPSGGRTLALPTDSRNDSCHSRVI